MSNPELLVARYALDAAEAALHARALVAADDPRADALDRAIDAMQDAAEASLTRALETRTAREGSL